MKIPLSEEFYINKVNRFREDAFSKIASAGRGLLWREASLRDVKKVVIINSSPRSGSSLLFALLKRLPSVYSLSGESTPFYKLNGLLSDSFDSDEIPAGLEADEKLYNSLSRDFLSDASFYQEDADIAEDESARAQYIDDIILRLSMQWPQVEFSYEAARQLAVKAINAHLKKGPVFCIEDFYLELLGLLMREHKGVNPYYYDIPEAKIRKKFPDLAIPAGPPDGTALIEEPPFILLPPVKKIEAKRLRDKTFLLKTSIDSYRMPFLERVFSGAQIKIVYLTRNPLASVNGLCDGWLYRGFFSHNLLGLLEQASLPFRRLSISGYSDRYEWAKHWWNYDLPAGWQEYANSSLEEVCAFQWLSANQSIGNYIESGKRSVYQLKYEDIVKSLSSRANKIKEVAEFIGACGCDIDKLAVDNMPVVQATQRPRLSRWKKRERALLPLLENNGISELCGMLGYDKNEAEDWL